MGKIKTNSTFFDKTSPEEIQQQLETLVNSIESTYEQMNGAIEPHSFASLKKQIKKVTDFTSATQVFLKEFEREMKKLTSTDYNLFKYRVPEHKMEHYIPLLNQETTKLHYPKLIALAIFTLDKAKKNNLTYLSLEQTGDFNELLMLNQRTVKRKINKKNV